MENSNSNLLIGLAGAIIGALAIIIAQFVTNRLEIKRKQKEKKRDIVLELIKGCRFFINEQDVLKDKEKHQQLRDRFQDSYFPFSLVISEEAYDSLMGVMETYGRFLEKSDDERLKNFKNAQKRFVNKLRKEVFDEEEIDFGTYDFRISEKGK